MKTEIAITKYDKPRAKGLFALFKALELFGVFLLTFGFYGLGSLVHKHFPEFYFILNSDSCVSYFCIWITGLVTFLFVGMVLFGAVLLLIGICLLIKKWVQGNWYLAKYFAEDKDAKEKRLNEIKKQDRKKRGYCVGDEVEIVLGNSHHKGLNGNIIKFYNNGNLKVDFGNHDHNYYKSEVKVIKKYPIKIGYAKTEGKTK